MVTVVVEGDTDVPVVRKLFGFVGLEAGSIIDASGKATIDKKIRAYNAAARGGPWFVLRDLDKDAQCPGVLVDTLVPLAERHSNMCLRIAVREIESWLLADAEEIAKFLRVSVSQVPHQPDTLDDPTRTLIELARSSKKPEIRKALVPGKGASVGIGYEGRIIEFAARHWRVASARMRSPSLDRCILALERLKERVRQRGI